MKIWFPVYSSDRTYVVNLGEKISPGSGFEPESPANRDFMLTAYKGKLLMKIWFSDLPSDKFYVVILAENSRLNQDSNPSLQLL